ncbi:hypothetical protein [Roseicyclus marinus]|uniref:hypothetical protein n=1 Tax=Roseicyclus marinus TaxID=2161673 RepID=UPI002410A44B|nr:hypothetical protein [Roseicyclus marinus]MDG3042441.1 hypothetical protein [Roseicyclus marinus]
MALKTFFFCLFVALIGFVAFKGAKDVLLSDADSNVVLDLLVEINGIPPSNPALGSIFSIDFSDVDLACGAGFVSSVGTRIYQNQNDIEFWCRRPDDTLIDWQSLGRPLQDFPSSMVGNVGGDLYEYIARTMYDFEAQQWIPLIDLGGIDTAGMGSYVFRTADVPWSIVYNYQNCQGLSAVSADGYFGTLPLESGESFSAATIWRGYFYANIGNEVVRAPLNEVREACFYLAEQAIIPDNNYIYAMYPIADRLLIGGGGWPFLESSQQNCPLIYSVDPNGSVDQISLRNCERDHITEIYGFSLADDAVVAGTYPMGELYAVESGSSFANRTGLPRFQVEPWERDDGTRNLESQALVSSYGMLFVGMFPWGELYYSDAIWMTNGGSHRVFSYPTRSSSKEPYFVPALRAYCPGDLVEVPNCIEGARLDLWGQRVTSIAVLDGKICVGTGNTFATVFDEDEHTFVPPHSESEYGAVHCALLKNQTLAPFVPEEEVVLNFRITVAELIVERDGEILARQPHDLDEVELAALTGGRYSIDLGVGAYGETPADVSILTD